MPTAWSACMSGVPALAAPKIRHLGRPQRQSDSGGARRVVDPREHGHPPGLYFGLQPIHRFLWPIGALNARQPVRRHGKTSIKPRQDKSRDKPDRRPTPKCGFILAFASSAPLNPRRCRVSPFGRTAARGAGSSRETPIRSPTRAWSERATRSRAERAGRRRHRVDGQEGRDVSLKPPFSPVPFEDQFSLVTQVCHAGSPNE